MSKVGAGYELGFMGHEFSRCGQNDVPEKNIKPQTTNHKLING